MARIHVFGAAGSGTTTIAGLLADRGGWPAFDTDDYYWIPTDPPYRDRRPVWERLDRLRDAVAPLPHFTLSGSLDGWGDPLVPLFDVVVFVTLETPSRMARLQARERRRFGAAIEPGGVMHATSRAFMEWAEGYDSPVQVGRSRDRHETWMAKVLTQPVVRVHNDRPIEAVMADLFGALGALGIDFGAR